MASAAGIKQRRTAKHRTKYASQKFRTSRNKANKAARITRRKAKYPQAHVCKSGKRGKHFLLQYRDRIRDDDEVLIDARLGKWMPTACSGNRVSRRDVGFYRRPNDLKEAA